MTNDNNTPEIKCESWGDDPAGAFERLLCSTGVRVVVNGADPALICPPYLRCQRFVLDYEIDPPTPIQDLVADRDGIRATLSFGRDPWATFVPWSAVLFMWPLRLPRVETPPMRPKLRAV